MPRDRAVSLLRDGTAYSARIGSTRCNQVLITALAKPVWVERANAIRSLEQEAIACNRLPAAAAPLSDCPALKCVGAGTTVGETGCLQFALARSRRGASFGWRPKPCASREPSHRTLSPSRCSRPHSWFIWALLISCGRALKARQTPAGWWRRNHLLKR